MEKKPIQKKKIQIKNTDSFNCIVIEINGSQIVLLIPQTEEKKIMKFHQTRNNILILDPELLKH